MHVNAHMYCPHDPHVMRVAYLHERWHVVIRSVCITLACEIRCADPPVDSDLTPTWRSDLDLTHS